MSAINTESHSLTQRVIVIYFTERSKWEDLLPVFDRIMLSLKSVSRNIDHSIPESRDWTFDVRQ